MAKRAKISCEISVDEKSNEISAVPELLDLIDVEGEIVTADAMSCQKRIVKKVTEKGAEYVIGLKGNQPALYGDTEEYFAALVNQAKHGRLSKKRMMFKAAMDPNVLLAILFPVK